MNPTNTAAPQQPPVQAQPAAPAPQPMTTPTVTASQTTVSAPHKSSKKLLLVLLFMLLIAVVVGVVGYLYVSKNNSSMTNKQAYVPPQKQTVSPTPTPEVTVANSTQLDSAINEVNNTSTATIESEYNQAATEAKSL